MERITHKGADGQWYQNVNFEGDVLECLAAYEDTGLTPEEIERLRGEMKAAYDEKGELYHLEAEGNEAKHFRELLQAEWEANHD